VAEFVVRRFREGRARERGWRAGYRRRTVIYDWGGGLIWAALPRPGPSPGAEALGASSINGRPAGHAMALPWPARRRFRAPSSVFSFPSRGGPLPIEDGVRPTLSIRQKHPQFAAG